MHLTIYFTGLKTVLLSFSMICHSTLFEKQISKITCQILILPFKCFKYLANTVITIIYDHSKF